MKYTVTFLVLALGCLVLGLVLWELSAWLALALVYPALSFLLLALVYGGAGPRLLGKQATGRRPLWAWLLFAPYFLLNELLFFFYCLGSSEPAHTQVSSNLTLGRRLRSCESLGDEALRVLDLAAEFVGSAKLRKLPGYRSLPVLDATAPTEEQLRSAIAWIDAGISRGPIYVHCALGHGRSACVVIGYFLSTKIVTSVAEGEQRIRRLRPGVRLNAVQRQRLRAFEPGPGKETT